MQVQVFGNHHIHNRVTQKFQALVVLVAMASMGHRQQQAFWHFKLVPQFTLQFFEIRR